MPVLEEFQTLIETNPRIYMYFAAMWDEVPHRPCYRRDPTGERQIRDYKHMLQVLNHVFTRAPSGLTPPPTSAWSACRSMPSSTTSWARRAGMRRFWTPT